MTDIYKLKTTFETEFGAEGPQTHYSMTLYAEDDDGDDVLIPIDVEQLAVSDHHLISMHVHSNVREVNKGRQTQITLAPEHVNAIRQMVAIKNLLEIQEDHD